MCTHNLNNMLLNFLLIMVKHTYGQLNWYKTGRAGDKNFRDKRDCKITLFNVL